MVTTYAEEPEQLVTPPTVLLTSKSITLKFGAAVFTQQTTDAHIETEENTDEIELVTGDIVEVSKGTKFTLMVSALQDWTEGATVGLFGILAAAYAAKGTVAFTIELIDAAGKKATMGGVVRGTIGQFGGPPGALLADLELPAYNVTGPTYA